MNIRFGRAIIPIVVFALIGCDEPGASICGDGREITIQGLELCVYEGNVVIETGFRCPTERPYEHEIDDARVCADRRLDEEQVEEVRERLEEEEEAGEAQYQDMGFDVTEADTEATAWTDVEYQDATMVVDTEPAVDMQNACVAETVGCRLAGTERDYDLVVEAYPLATLECLVEVGEGVAFDFWEVIERPEDSVAQFEPSADVPNPTFFLDLAGEWSFSPRFHWEAGGDVACAAPLVQVIACPCYPYSTHVQLVWETEGDENPFDELGSDVDLHFLHETGTWGESPGDCYWNNQSPDWGEIGEALDDPNLDIDDTDGWGPENINLEWLEDGVVYRIGVHYKDDGGFGPSAATIRLFFSGEERYASTVELNATGRFCEVAALVYDESEDDLDIIDIGTCSDGYPE